MSMAPIEKAVVPVAGLGTRMLPATKSQPKEMLPVGRKPVVQYVVEELAHQGLKDVLFVTGWKKRAIEDHFDESPELVERLTGKRQWRLLDVLNDAQAPGMNFYYVRQRTPRGLGDAVAHARRFVGKDQFVVALGDAIIYGGAYSDLLRRMMDVHLRHGPAATVAVERLEGEELGMYGVVKPSEDPEGGDFALADIVEKPSPEEAPSPFAVAARYVFDPIIFQAIERTPQVHGEVGLSHAIRTLLKMGAPVRCVVLRPEERRFDIGNFGSYFKAFTFFALRDPEYGPSLRDFLRREVGGL